MPFAGLETAILSSDWDGFDVRLIILITDAGARRRFDPWADNLEVGAEEIAEMARIKNVAIIPIHLLTPQAASHANHATAREQYQVLGRTGDFNVNKYIGIPAGDPDVFNDVIISFANSFAEDLQRFARGRLVQRDDSIDMLTLDVNVNDRLANVVTNELFRMQLEYIGAARDKKPPRFYRAWAADLDLIDPRRVFTRSKSLPYAQSIERPCTKFEADH